MNTYFQMNETIFDITEKYPDIIPYLVKKGFTPLSNPVMRGLMGKKITMEKVLQSKNLDAESCEKEMIAIIEKNASDSDCADISLRNTIKESGAADSDKQRLRIEGILPCPIRIPLFERFKSFFTAYTQEHKAELSDYAVSYNLRPANLGIDWLVEDIQKGTTENVPDVLLSAGFDLFFDKKLIGKFIENKDFQCSIGTMNTDFCNESIDLRDPQNNYAIIGTVPAIMVVNTAVLNGRPIPETWADILSDAFAYSISLPVGDLDLFNSVILNIYSRFGDEGIKKLSKGCKEYLHPSQMVKANRPQAQSQPAVSIAPYFFSRMVQQNTHLKAVWPKDGAIIAPIFMLVKKKTAAVAQPFADFFLSEQTGTIFAQSGYFPSTNPAVDNKLTPEQTFSWIGWDFIYQNDIGKLLKKLTWDFKDRSLQNKEKHRV